MGLEKNQKFIIKREVWVGTDRKRNKSNYKDNKNKHKKTSKSSKVSIIVARTIFMPVSMYLISSIQVALEFESGNRISWA